MVVKSLFKSRGLYQSFIIMVGSLVASGLSAISLILITRQLGPAKFGEFSVGFAILLILVRLNDLGMTNVVQKYAAREEDRAKANKIFSFATRVRLIGTLVIWVSGLLLARPIADLLNFSEPLIIYLAFFLSTGISMYEHIQAMLQSLHRFGQAAWINILQAIAKVLGAAVLFFTASHATVPIFAWYVFAPALPLLFLPIYFPKWVKIRLQDKFSDQKKLLTVMAGHSAVAFIAAGIIENIDVLFVQRYLSTYEAGLLGGVGRVALLFSILAYALSSVLNPRVAKYTNAKDLRAFFKKAWLMAGAAMLFLIAYLPFSKLILLYTIGEQYLPGLDIMNILVASSLMTVAVVPFIAFFFSIDRPWYFSVSGLTQLAIILVGNGVFVPIYGLEAAAWTRLLARAFLFIMTAGLALYFMRDINVKRGVNA